MVQLSGPMFEPSKTDYWESSFNKTGAHCNIYNVKYGMEMYALKQIFPKAEADEMNLVLFSTSGIHGTYNTIEQAEKHLKEPENDNYFGEVTFILIQPRIVCMRYGNVRPKNQNEIDYLKKLRQSSWDTLLTIGKEYESAI